MPIIVLGYRFLQKTNLKGAECHFSWYFCCFMGRFSSKEIFRSFFRGCDSQKSIMRERMKTYQRRLKILWIKKRWVGVEKASLPKMKKIKPWKQCKEKTRMRLQKKFAEVFQVHGFKSRFWSDCMRMVPWRSSSCVFPLVFVFYRYSSLVMISWSFSLSSLKLGRTTASRVQHCFMISYTTAGQPSGASIL